MITLDDIKYDIFVITPDNTIKTYKNYKKYDLGTLINIIKDIAKQHYLTKDYLEFMDCNLKLDSSIYPKNSNYGDTCTKFNYLFNVTVTQKNTKEGTIQQIKEQYKIFVDAYIEFGLNNEKTYLIKHNVEK